LRPGHDGGHLEGSFFRLDILVGDRAGEAEGAEVGLDAGEHGRGSGSRVRCLSVDTVSLDKV